MRLLHVVFVASFEDSALTLLVVEKAQFHLDVHWVFKFFDSLLHRAKVACKVVFGLFFDERKDDGQLVKKVIDSMQNGMQGQIRICREEKLMLHQYCDLDAELLLSA